MLTGLFMENGSGGFMGGTYNGIFREKLLEIEILYTDLVFNGGGQLSILRLRAAPQRL